MLYLLQPTTDSGVYPGKISTIQIIRIFRKQKLMINMSFLYVSLYITHNMYFRLTSMRKQIKNSIWILHKLSTVLRSARNNRQIRAWCFLDKSYSDTEQISTGSSFRTPFVKAIHLFATTIICRKKFSGIGLYYLYQWQRNNVKIIRKFMVIAWRQNYPIDNLIL